MSLLVPGKKKIDVLTSVRAVNYVFQILSLSQVDFNMVEKKIMKNRFLQFYSWLVLIIEILTLIYGIFLGNTNNGFMTEVTNTVAWILLIGIRVVNVTAIIESLMSIKNQQLFFEYIQNIDKTIEHSLNYKFDHKKARLKSILYGLAILSLYLVCELFILGSFFTYQHKDKELTISYWIQYLLPLLLSGSRYFQIFFYVNLINQRIIKINDFLHEIKLVQDSLPVATVKLFNINSKGQQGVGFVRLLAIRQLYNSLYKLTNVFNKCFGLSILISVGNDFLSITSNCYWIFLQASSNSVGNVLRILASTAWTIPHLFTIIMIASTCHKAAQNVSK